MLVLGSSNLRRDLEVATFVGILDRERHDESVWSKCHWQP